MYITRGPKILSYNLKYMKRKMSSHFPVDHVDSSENFSNLVSYLAENRMRDTVFLETENWIRLLRHYLNLLCELNSIGQ